MSLRWFPPPWRFLLWEIPLRSPIRGRQLLSAPLQFIAFIEEGYPKNVYGSLQKADINLTPNWQHLKHTRKITSPPMPNANVMLNSHFLWKHSQDISFYNKSFDSSPLTETRTSPRTSSWATTFWFSSSAMGLPIGLRVVPTKDIVLCSPWPRVSRINFGL